ncbi:hypothetical protein PG996_010441 [Apiospora saccharicola]|uniref:MARVEL domain-containing protein n=1 Tax=Apiospora saccharicola TaxID=335842 RepID=A0ABR1UNL2_9PEZI
MPLSDEQNKLTHHRPNMAVVSQLSPDSSQDGKVIAVFMAMIMATLAVSRHYIQDLSTISSIFAFILLKVSTWTMGGFVLYSHDLTQQSYMHEFPSRWLDCNVASLLALCAYVIYNQGHIGLAFFTYHASLCYWAGYWLEWWTGVVGLAFSVFGCTAVISNRPSTPPGDHAVQAGMKPGPSALGSDEDAGAEMGERPPAYSTEPTDAREWCISRFIFYIARLYFWYGKIMKPNRPGASNSR